MKNTYHPKKNIAVIGAGAWGSALALALHRAGHGVFLWSKNDSVRDSLEKNRCNPRYLDVSILFPDDITICNTAQEAMTAATHILLAVPSHAFAGIVDQLPLAGKSVCWATKGFVSNDTPFLHEYFAHATNKRAGAGVALSGPSFSALVAHDLPTAVVFASEDISAATEWAQLFHHGFFQMRQFNQKVFPTFRIALEYMVLAIVFM